MATSGSVLTCEVAGVAYGASGCRRPPYALPLALPVRSVAAAAATAARLPATLRVRKPLSLERDLPSPSDARAGGGDTSRALALPDRPDLPLPAARLELNPLGYDSSGSLLLFPPLSKLTPSSPRRCRTPVPRRRALGDGVNSADDPDDDDDDAELPPEYAPPSRRLTPSPAGGVRSPPNPSDDSEPRSSRRSTRSDSSPDDDDVDTRPRC